MRAVVQRVSRASVTIDGRIVGSITRGYLVLAGFGPDDRAGTAKKMAAKIAGLRLFPAPDGRMSLGLTDVGGAILAVSQFTLFGDVRRGRRPSFAGAALPGPAEALYEAFCEAVEAEGVRCARGEFGADMAVELVNDGPVTLILDSADFELPRRP